MTRKLVEESLGVVVDKSLSETSENVFLITYKNEKKVIKCKNAAIKKEWIILTELCGVHGIPSATLESDFLILPFFGGGDLAEFASNPKLKFPLIQWIFTSLTILKESHKKKISHGDIKLDNFVVDDSLNLFLIDWETAQTSDTDRRTGVTEAYEPPWSSLNRFEFDLWCLGVTFYTLLSRSVFLFHFGKRNRGRSNAENALKKAVEHLKCIDEVKLLLLQLLIPMGITSQKILEDNKDFFEKSMGQELPRCY